VLYCGPWAGGSMAEQGPFKPRVAGSSPARLTQAPFETGLFVMRLAMFLLFPFFM
jgi:hypothetical protein